MMKIYARVYLYGCTGTVIDIPHRGMANVAWDLWFDGAEDGWYPIDSLKVI